MNRNETWQNECKVAPADAAESPPVRELLDVLADIQIDAATQPARYLNESEVPYGGE